MTGHTAFLFAKSGNLSSTPILPCPQTRCISYGEWVAYENWKSEEVEEVDTSRNYSYGPCRLVGNSQSIVILNRVEVEKHAVDQALSPMTGRLIH